jgi:aspartyl-tRNA(Asn)/glutamyl-tRNA(Gln) amidotransferase subunit A
MTAAGRFADWTSLDLTARRTLAASACDHARRLQRRLNAFVSIEDGPLEPVVAGPLAGLPYAVKDLFITGAHRPTAGLAQAVDFGLTGPAEALDLFDAAGACRVGFTEMTELAYEPSGYNAARGRVANPWNLDFISGGSSSGSAAAVASGAATLGFGSDTGGSLRIPAHCCGVTGWKPTYGAVSTAGALPLAPTLDVIGLLAQGAADLIAGANVVASASLPREPTPIGRAVIISDALGMTEPAVRRACQQGLDAIEACGLSFVRTDALPAIEAIDAHALTAMQAEAARTHRALLESGALEGALRKRLAKGLTIDDATLAGARTARPSLARAFSENVLRDADIALLPVMAVRVPTASEVDPASPTFSGRRLYELSRFCRFVNMLGFPAVAIPVGFDDRGLPVALQLVGRPDSDFSLLALAAAVQARTEWHARVPAAIADLVLAGGESR